MKRRITKPYLLEFIEELDTRAAKLSSSQKDRIIDTGFAEICTIFQPFSAEIIEPLQDRYELGELAFTISTPSSSTDVYDVFLLREDQDEQFFVRGDEQTRDENRIWKDSRDINIVHVNLENDVAYDSAVVKYFYIPSSNFDEIYISADVYAALEHAIAAAAYDTLHDVERSSQKRAAMNRMAASVVNVYPEDYGQPGKPSMFPDGV